MSWIVVWDTFRLIHCGFLLVHCDFFLTGFLSRWSSGRGRPHLVGGGRIDTVVFVHGVNGSI